MSDIINIRRAIKTDISRIEYLWKSLMSGHSGSHNYFMQSQIHYNQHIEKQLMKQNVLILVAEKYNHIVGYIHIEIVNPQKGYIKHELGFIHELVVQEEYRKQGIGKQLYDQCLIWLKKHQITHIELEVASINANARRFWLALGFIDHSNIFIKDIY